MKIELCGIVNKFGKNCTNKKSIKMNPKSGPISRHYKTD